MTKCSWLKPCNRWTLRLFCISAVTLFSLLTKELNFGPLPSLLKLVSAGSGDSDARCADVLTNA